MTRKQPQYAPPINKSAFRNVERSYRTFGPNPELPDLTNVFDFTNLDNLTQELKDKVQTIPLVKGLSENLFKDIFHQGSGLETSSLSSSINNSKSVTVGYTISTNPGLLVIPNPFYNICQQKLVQILLKEGSRPPNRSNIHAHYDVPDCGVWELYERIKNNENVPDILKIKPNHSQHVLDGYSMDEYQVTSIENIKLNTCSNTYTNFNTNSSTCSNGNSNSCSNANSNSNTNSNTCSNTNHIENNVTTCTRNKNGSGGGDIHDPSLPLRIDPTSLLHRLRWTTLGYNYEWTTKSYIFDPPPPPIPSVLTRISKTILAHSYNFHGYEASSFCPQAGIINYYRGKDRLTGHVDRSELNMDAPLVSLSFGISAILLMGGDTVDVEPSAILVRSGDIIIMSGEARKCFHGIVIL